MFIRRMVGDMGDNIIIGSVETVVHDLAGNEGVIGDADGAVADQQHGDMITPCDFIYFVFDGAGIGVDQNMEHDGDDRRARAGMLAGGGAGPARPLFPLPYDR